MCECLNKDIELFENKKGFTVSIGEIEQVSHDPDVNILSHGFGVMVVPGDSGNIQCFKFNYCPVCGQKYKEVKVRTV